MFRRKTEIQKFIEKNPWSDIHGTIGFFMYKGLVQGEDYSVVKDRDQIEKFAYESKKNLKPNGTYVGHVGDADWINNNFNSIYGIENIQQNIADTLDRCGPNSINITMPYSVFEKYGKPLENAQTLQDLGVKVKIRDIEPSLRAIVVDQKDDGNIEYIKAMVWRRVARETSYGRKEGYPQGRDAMETFGWKMECSDLNDRIFQAEILNGLRDYSNYILDVSDKTVDYIKKERESLRFLDEIGKFSKNMMCEVMGKDEDST